MNSIHMQAVVEVDEGTHSIDGGFDSRRRRRWFRRGVVLLYPTIEGKNGEHTVKFKAQSSIGTLSKGKVTNRPSKRPSAVPLIGQITTRTRGSL